AKRMERRGRLAGQDDDAGVGAPADGVRQRRAGAFDLTGPALAAQLAHQLGDLAERGGAEGLPLGEQPTVRVDDTATTERRGTGVEERGRATGLTEAEFLARAELAGRVRVLALDDVEVPGPSPASS